MGKESKMMTRYELLQRMNDIEWEDFEVKEAKNELPKNVWETVSSFANSSGGWIVLGVKQSGKKFEVCGVDNAEKLEQDFVGTIRSQQKFNAPLDIISKLYHINGCRVLAFHVASSPKKPIYFNNPQNTFIRYGSGDQRATNDEITAMFRDQSFGIKSNQPIPETGISMLNMDSVHSYRNFMAHTNGKGEWLALDDNAFLVKIGVCVSKGLLTYGGMIMFGKYECLREYVPTFWMDLIEIPGKSVDTAKVRYTYRIPEQDNLWEYYMVMIKRLRQVTDTPFKMNSQGINVEDDSQLRVMREALVNMLMHTDHFSTIHSCVRIFTDRIEFFNAGSYPIPVDQLGKGLYSNPRNPNIAKFFRLANLSETVGYGIDIMRSWKKLTGFPMKIESDITSSTASFYKADDGVNDRVNDRVRAILQYCKQPRSRRQVLSYIGLAYHSDSYNKYIAPLIQRGLIEFTIPERPHSRSQKYKVTENGILYLQGFDSVNDRVNDRVND